MNVGAGALDIRNRVDALPANATYPLVVDFYVSDASGPGSLFVGTDTIDEPDATTWRNVVITRPSRPP